MINLIKKNNINYFNKINLFNCYNSINNKNIKYVYNSSNIYLNNSLINSEINNRNYSTKKKVGNNNSNGDSNNVDNEIGNSPGGKSKIIDMIIKSGVDFSELSNVRDFNEFKKKLESISLAHNKNLDNDDDFTEELSEDVQDNDNDNDNAFNDTPKVTFKFKPWRKKPKSIFPKTAINLKKKVNENILLSNQLKNINNELCKPISKSTKSISSKLTNEEKDKPKTSVVPEALPKSSTNSTSSTTSTTATSTSTSKSTTDISFGFGINNIKFDTMFEAKKKEEEIKRKEREEFERMEKERLKKERIEKERQLKVLESKRRSLEKRFKKRNHSIKLNPSSDKEKRKDELYKKASEKVYQKIKSFQLKRINNRELNKVKSSNLSTIKFNKTDPFQHYFNMSDLESILNNYKLIKSNSQQDQKEQLSFKDRLNLHLYSFQLYLQGNLFKESTPTTMLYNNLNKLILKDQDKRIIEESLNNEDYFKLFEKVREYHQSNFIQDNLALSYALKYLKSNSKLYRFFQLLENININQTINPLDYSDMIQIFLNDGQLTSAEMLTSNMESYFQEFYPEVFIHYYEYFKNQGNLSTSQIFSEFMSIFNEFSATEKEYMLMYNPIIEREKARLAQLGQPLTEEAINRAINESEIDNSKQLRNLALYKPILIHCYKNSDIEFAEMLEDKMEREGIKLDLETFNNKIKYQATEGYHLNEDNLTQLAYNVKPSKKKKISSDDKFKGNSQTYMAILYYHLIVEKDLNNSLNSLELFQKKWNFKLNKYLLNQLIWGLSRINSIDISINYYNQLKQLNSGSSSGISSNNMNDSVILYCMSYYNYKSDSLTNFIRDNNIQIDTPILDLITFGYLLNNKFKQINNFNNNQEINNNNNASNNNNNIENLIEVLDYLSSEKSIIMDNTQIQFLLGRLADLKKQYNIKPSKRHFILLKNLINNSK